MADLDIVNEGVYAALQELDGKLRPEPTWTMLWLNEIDESIHKNVYMLLSKHSAQQFNKAYNYCLQGFGFPYVDIDPRDIKTFSKNRKVPRTIEFKEEFGVMVIEHLTHNKHEALDLAYLTTVLEGGEMTSETLHTIHVNPRAQSYPSLYPVVKNPTPNTLVNALTFLPTFNALEVLTIDEIYRVLAYTLHTREYDWSDFVFKVNQI